MKDTVTFIFEVIRIIFILFFALVGYSIINSLIIDFFGGTDAVFGDSEMLRTWFFLLQALGVLGLVTVLYRNKQKKSGWMAKYQGPLQPKTVRLILRVSIAAIVASYGIFFGLVLFA
ncbi:hypothetical protein [Salisediminibacterium beveridgei]|uniref:Uncharacterized protein n=1 Tax=Salisediminibacterium beveridgei TaxID=632773 RepID=A0A1D7QYV5_9BACI|nr:hypothetical protein [Salisediminibacterium beveridgei]AOM84195.1 hypothetical protein BBEV_2870 [Salisediminibacterium beveridgei]